MLETFGYEFDPDQLEVRQCYGGAGQERLQFGEPCCLKTFQNETCAWFQSDVATPLQLISIPFLLIITIGLPIFFQKLIRGGIDELYRGGYRLKRDTIQRSIDSKTLDIKNINKLRQLISKRKQIPSSLIKYDTMGHEDVIREVKRLKEEVAELKVKQNDLYTQEVQANPKAQTYLYAPYSFSMRYYKLVSMAQKVLLYVFYCLFHQVLFVAPKCGLELL